MAADKRSIRSGIKKLQAIKTWQLLIVLLLMCFVAATFLRMNNTGMIMRKNAVLEADKAGDVEALSYRLVDLQRFSAAHMNASVATFELQGQYSRDVQKALDNMKDSNQNAYAAADAVCKPRYHGWSTAYMNCFLAELDKYPTTEKLDDIKKPDTAIYRYSFVSPAWSPDFAGFSVLVCAFLVIVIVVRVISLVILRLLLRRHYREA